MDLSEKIKILSAADNNTAWGFAIKNELRYTNRRLDLLIEQLHSQYLDNPELMKTILPDIEKLF